MEEYKEDYVVHDYGEKVKLPSGEHTPEYFEWIKDAEIKDLTNAQSRFAEWCFTQKDILCQVGDLDKIFSSVRSHLRTNKKKKKP